MEKNTPVSILRAALESQLNSLVRGRIVYLGPRDKARDGVPLEEPQYNSWFQPHHHRYGELIQLISGQAKLALSTGRIRLVAGRTYFILPGVEHEEKPGDRRAYAVLVTSVSGSSSVFWFLSTRYPDGRVAVAPKRVSDRLLYRSEEIGDLNRMARTREILRDAQARALCQAILIRASAEAWKNAGTWPINQLEHRRSIAQDMVAYLDQHFNQAISLSDLADMLQSTSNYLNGVFRHATGKTIHQYILDRRMEEARKLLLRERRIVKEAALESGFKDALYFSRLFRERFGESPSAFRKRGLQ